MGARDPASAPGPFGVRIEAPRFVQIAVAVASDDAGHAGEEVVYALDAEGGVWWYDFAGSEWVPLKSTRADRP